MRHSGAKCAHAYLLCSYTCGRAGLRSPPPSQGRASPRQDFSHTSTTLQVLWRATETQQENFSRLLPATREMRGGRLTTASNSYCTSTETKESAWNLLEEYLSLLSSGSWGACLGKLYSKLDWECSWAALFSPYKSKKSCNLPLVLLQFDIYDNGYSETLRARDRGFHTFHSILNNQSYTPVNTYSYNWTWWLLSSLLSKSPPIFYYYCVILCRAVGAGAYCHVKIQDWQLHVCLVFLWNCHWKARP